MSILQQANEYHASTRQSILVGGRPIGFVYQTLGGFFRGYSHTTGLGAGPFPTRTAANQFVKAEHERDQ